jgi:hypothetical protein
MRQVAMGYVSCGTMRQVQVGPWDEDGCVSGSGSRDLKKIQLGKSRNLK